MSEKPPVVNCPSCQQKVEWIEANNYRPFCSLRCKNKDFLGWANEEHVIGGNSVYDEVLSEELNKT